MTKTFGFIVHSRIYLMTPITHCDGNQRLSGVITEKRQLLGAPDSHCETPLRGGGRLRTLRGSKAPLGETSPESSINTTGQAQKPPPTWEQVNKGENIEVYIYIYLQRTHRFPIERYSYVGIN